jgi:hypothetical protein
MSSFGDGFFLLGGLMVVLGWWVHRLVIVSLLCGGPARLKCSAFIPSWLVGLLIA